MATPLGRLHLRGPEECESKALKENEENFHNFIEMSHTSKASITWWRNNILTRLVPILRNNSSILINTAASFYDWGASRVEQKSVGLFSIEESKLC